MRKPPRHLLSFVAFTALAAAGCEDASSSTDAGNTPGYDAGTDADPNSVDMQDYACNDPDYVVDACAAPRVTQADSVGAQHIAEGTPISYEASPPSSGNHRSQWARWGTYAYLPPQRWLHNLEHGGVAFLYHPCAPEALIAELDEMTRVMGPDETGDFRFVMTPYPDLPSAIAVVAWENAYEANCVDSEAIADFVADNYRRAPEDIASDGRFTDLWLERRTQ